MVYALNPFFIYVTIRGNCEAITVALYFAFLYFYFSESVSGSISAYERRDKGLMVRQPDRIKRYLSYAVFGLVVHFRIFPVIFVPLMIMHEYHSVKKDKFQHAFKFTIEFALISSSMFLVLAAFFYNLYGYDFLY